MELIKISEYNGSNVISAKELHSFLEIKEKFTQWIDRMFEYGFSKNVDYQSLSDFSEKPKGGRPSIDYALSMDCAKEISMLQRSDKGKQARLYFIECEKRLKNPIQNISRIELAKMIIEAEQEKERLQQENNRLQTRTQFVDVVFNSDDLLTGSQVCKILKLPYGNRTLYKKLRESGVFFKGRNEPKQNLVDRGYFRMKEIVIGEKVKLQTYFTQKGLGYIAKFLNVINPPANTVKFINQ